MEDVIKLELLSDVSQDRQEYETTEVIYAADGSCLIWIEGKEKELNKNEAIIINAEQKYKICAENKSLVCRLSYPCSMICRLSGEDYVIFHCSRQKRAAEYVELIRQIKEILLEYAGSRRLYRLSAMYQTLLAHLLENFKVTGISSESRRQWEDSRKLSIIKNYVHEHYTEGSNLTKLAEKMYLSPSSLSRFFRKASGESFVSYVRKYRLKKAAQALTDTDLSVARIAADNGFCTSSAMTKDFRQFFGMTPVEFRAKNRKKQSVCKNEDTQQSEQRLRTMLEKEENRQKKKIIEADVSSGERYRPWKTKIVNMGDVSLLQYADMQKHILMLKQKLNIEYVRIWSVFSTDLMITEGKEQQYNFHYINSVLDFCVDHQLKVFLDMGPRTHQALSSENRYIYKTEKGIEFHSEEQWLNMLEQFYRNIRRRYSTDIVNEWIIEFTFFLNERPYYISKNYSSRRVWNLGYETTKRYFPDMKVAGPGLRAGMGTDLENDVLDAFFSTSHVPDIFTSYNFPYEETEKKDGLRKLSDTEFLKKQISDIREQLRLRGYHGQYYVTDWNNSLANRNYVQDSCYRGSYFLKTILENYESVDAMGIWYGSDLLNFYYDSSELLSGSGGLISKDDICKPVFYALSFLNRTGKYRVVQGENYLITENDDNDIYILCFNSSKLDFGYYFTEENMHRPDEVVQIFQDRKMLHLMFDLKGFRENGTCTVRQKIVSEKSGSVLENWGRMGFEKNLVYEDLEYLRRISAPEIRIEHTEICGRHIHLDIELEPNEFRWICIQKD